MNTSAHGAGKRCVYPPPASYGGPLPPLAASQRARRSATSGNGTSSGLWPLFLA